MDKDLLLEVTVSRKEDAISYKVNRSLDISNDELEYYLKEILEGICKWKPKLCEETMHSCTGKIGKNRIKK